MNRNLLILVVVALLGLLSSLTSCSTGVEKSYYRVRSLETNVITVVSSIKRDYQQSYYPAYKRNDTVWVNLDSATIDAADSTAMLAVVEYRL